MKRHLWTGALTLLIIAALSIFLIRLSGSLQYRNTYTLHAYVDNAQGLVDDAQITLSGIEIGRLRRMSLADSKVFLTLSIQDAVQLPEDSKLRISTQSLFGSSALEIIPGRAVGMLQEGDYFVQMGTGSPGLNSMLDAVQDDMTQTLALIDENLLIIKDILLPLSRIIENIDLQTAQQLTNIDLLLKQSLETVRLAGTAVGDNDEKLQTLLDGMNIAIANLNTIISNVQQGEGNIGKLLTDDALYTSVKNTAEQLEEITRTTVGPDLQIGYRAEVLTDFTSLDVGVKSHFDLRLVPQDSESYYSLGLVVKPDASPTRSTVEERVTDPTTGVSTTEIKEILTTTERSNLVISAQIAKSFFNRILTLRGGLIEGSPGFGIDIQPIQQLAISTEMFDFGQENNGGYLRAMLNVYPFYDPESNNPLQWLYLNLGADNILNDSRKYFAGLGIRFQDNNIRSAALLAPSVSSLAP